MKIKAKYGNSTYPIGRREADKWIEDNGIEEKIKNAAKDGKKFILIDIPLEIKYEDLIIEALQKAGFGVLLTKELNYKIVWDELEV